ncbi:MAG: CoA transferase [Acidobacteria bacterium]|nr:CoA transferase [Acidobacteriota bacterium]
MDTTAGQGYEELRVGVRDLCRRYPDTYWRELDRDRGYPEAFVRALTDAGYLAALIPEQYGGAGLGVTEASIILEEINRSGGNAAACHAQMYIMGTARSGLDARRLHDRFERLVTCAISGYGSSGPWSHRKAYDLLVQSETGLLSITGTAATACKAGISVADIAAGMYACQGILAALLQRVRTGRGTSLQVSLFDALTEWMSAPLYYTKYGGTAPSRTEAHHASIAPYGPFRCREDIVVVGLQNEREWGRFCDVVLERSELARDARFGSNSLRVLHRAELHEMVEGVFRDLSAADLLVRLEAAQIASARLNSIEDLIAHPQLRARERWCELQTPGGPIEALRPPVISDSMQPVMGAIPDVGQHTFDILRELGFDQDAIASWREGGVI